LSKQKPSIKMKTFKKPRPVYITLVLLLACLGVSCDDQEVAYNPPFNEFWFGTRFSVSSDEPNEFSNLKYYNTWGQMSGQDLGDGGYRYYLSNTSVQQPGGNGLVPEGSTLSISSQSPIMTISATGTMPREGDHVDKLYDGDHALWSESCRYSIEIQVNTLTEQVIKADLLVNSGGYKFKYDMSEKLNFSKGAAPVKWYFGLDETNHKYMESIHVGIIIDQN
jgi:hypothetical protein